MTGSVFPEGTITKNAPCFQLRFIRISSGLLCPSKKRTGMTVSQVADEVLYTGLLEMQELPDLSE